MKDFDCQTFARSPYSQEKSMIKLYNKETDVYIGEISEAELKFLVKELAEETYDDQDYYLDEQTLDYLTKRRSRCASARIIPKSVRRTWRG